MAKNNFTVEDWNRLEVERRERLKAIQERRSALNAKRGDLLIQMQDGGSDEKAARKEIAEIEKEDAELRLESESIEAILTAIPNKRDFARAREIEDEITTLEKLDEQLRQLVPAIDAAAEGFVLAVKNYFDVLRTMHLLDAQTFHFQSLEHGIWDSIGVYFRKFDLWGFVKVGAFRDAKTMTDNLERNPSRKQIAGRIRRMRENAKHLRGEAVEREYCPNCYGNLKPSYGGDSLAVNRFIGSAPERVICDNCGREKL